MSLPEFVIQQPFWMEGFLTACQDLFPADEDKMHFVISLARQNVQHRTGGPFGAAIFDSAGRLIAPGVNLVASSNCSILHAEMVAIALAQKILGRYDLSDGNSSHYDLAASTEPCAMCFGAVPWSGARRLLCGARDEDARAIGFDEGPKMADWVSALNDRGITVIRDVLRETSIAVLSDYAAAGGAIYNAGKLAKR